MIEVGKTYKSHLGHTVTVNAIYGGVVYYSDSWGCYYKKELRFFAFMYVGTDAYYELKAEVTQ